MKILRDEIEVDPKIGSTKLAGLLLQKSKVAVSPRTIRRSLNEFGLKGRIACRKPFLAKKHKLARIELTEKHISWSNEK